MSTREVLTTNADYSYCNCAIFHFSSLFNNKTTEQQPTSLENETKMHYMATDFFGGGLSAK